MGERKIEEEELEEELGIVRLLGVGFRGGCIGEGCCCWEVGVFVLGVQPGGGPGGVGRGVGRGE